MKVKKNKTKEIKSRQSTQSRRVHRRLFAGAMNSMYDTLLLK